MSFSLVLLISFILFSLGPTLDFTVEVWPDYIQCFVLIIFLMIPSVIGWIYLLPWLIIVCCLYEWRKWKRYRAIVILVPYIFIFISTASDLVASLSDPHRRFKRFALFELPNNLKDFRWHFRGGLGSNYSDTYYFRCSSNDTETIINGMGFEKYILHIVDYDEYDSFFKTNRYINFS